MELKLLPLQALIRTGPLDHADWNYRGLLGFITKKRFSLIKSLLPEQPSQRLLEIGYGSGIFLPELANHTKELYGIDIHDKHAEIESVLKDYGISASLSRAEASHLPFPSDYFDSVVSVSALEFVDDLANAVQEIHRVLKKGGSFLLVMPGTSPILDLGLYFATGESAARDYQDRRRHVLPELKKIFTLDRVKKFPPLIPIYTAFRFSK